MCMDDCNICMSIRLHIFVCLPVCIYVCHLGIQICCSKSSVFQDMLRLVAPPHPHPPGAPSFRRVHFFPRSISIYLIALAVIAERGEAEYNRSLVKSQRVSREKTIRKKGKRESVR